MKYLIIVCLTFSFNSFADFVTYEPGCLYKGEKHPIGTNIKIQMNLKEIGGVRFMIWQCQSNQVRDPHEPIFIMKVRWMLIGYTE